MKLEVIKRYWKEAVDRSNDLQVDQQFSTPQLVIYLNGHLPPDYEEMTKTKVNYLRIQGILSPNESGEGEMRTSWRYTVDDVRRAILIELLKTRENLSVQESKVWLQSLEYEQNRDILPAQEVQVISPKIAIPVLPTSVSSVYALIRNRILGTLITSLISGEVDVTPPQCFIAIRILNLVPEMPSILEHSWEQVQFRLDKNSWYLAASDSFSKLYAYSDLQQLQKNKPEVFELLATHQWFLVILEGAANEYYEILLGLSKEQKRVIETVESSLSQYIEEKLPHHQILPLQLSKYPGLPRLLEVAFLDKFEVNEGMALSVLAEIIAKASEAWDYCCILVPVPDGIEQKELCIQECSSGFPYKLKNKSIDVEKSLTGWCFRYHKIAVVEPTVQNDPRIAFYEEEGRPIAAAAAPAITEEQRVVGVIYVARNRPIGEKEIVFTPELIAILKAFGYICGDVIAREQIEVKTVYSLSQLMKHRIIEPFSDLDQMFWKVAEEISEGVSPDKVNDSWIYLLILNIQTTNQDSITQWLCQQGVEMVCNFLAYRYWKVLSLHPLPIGNCQVTTNQYVFCILQAVDLSEHIYKEDIIQLQKDLDQICIGRLIPDFYPSAVTFRFKDLYQTFADLGEDALVADLKKLTEERLKAGPYFNRGHVALSSADLDQAVSEFEDALRYVPHSAYGHKHLAEARMLQGTPKAIEQAIEHCRVAIEENPIYASAHCLLADCLAYQGSFGEAILQYEKTLALENTRSDFLTRYGLTLAGMTVTEYQTAIHDMQRESQNIQPRTFHGQPWQAAIDKFDRARNFSKMDNDGTGKEQEQRAQYHYQRGYAYLQANMLDKAIEDFTVGRKLAPNDVQLAQAYSYALSLRRKEKN